MTKGSVATDLDELSEELLEDLDHRERFGLTLKALADDHDHWRERLVETAPHADYHGIEPAYKHRTFVLRLLAERAVYDLHTRLLEYQDRQFTALHQELEALLEESEAADRASPLDNGPSSGERLGTLFFTYRAYRRFAERVVGVDLETWVATHPNGQSVVAAVEETVGRFDDEAIEIQAAPSVDPSERIDLDNEWLPDELPDAALERLVLARYQDLIETYQHQLERESVQTGYLGL